MSTDAPNTKPANILMALTYAIAALGIGLAFNTLGDPEPDLGWAALFAVGGGGLLSFVRHALFHRADAARIGWTSERTNAFQIEVGLANFAWGAYAVLAVVAGWGLAAESAGFLIFGFYMAAVAVYEVLNAGGENRRPWAQVIPSAAFGLILLAIGLTGMNAAT
jgi:hypothetical protein